MRVVNAGSPLQKSLTVRIDRQFDRADLDVPSSIPHSPSSWRKNLSEPQRKERARTSFSCVLARGNTTGSSTEAALHPPSTPTCSESASPPSLYVRPHIPTRTRACVRDSVGSRGITSVITSAGGPPHTNFYGNTNLYGEVPGPGGARTRDFESSPSPLPCACPHFFTRKQKARAWGATFCASESLPFCLYIGRVRWKWSINSHDHHGAHG